MKFSGINQIIYEEKILLPYQMEVAHAKKYIPLAIIGGIIAIPILIWATNISKEDYSSFILVASIGLSVPLFSLLGLFSYIGTRIRFKSQLHLPERQIEVEVLPNLYIQIREKGVLKATIKHIDSLYQNASHYSYVIKGSISAGDTLSSEYELSMAILEMERLVPYFHLNKTLKSNLQFQNMTLKNIMHMDEDTRKKLFIKELTDASFLVFGVLSSNTNLQKDTIEIYDNIYLELAHNQESFYVFTSKKEVDKELLKTYPIPYVLSLKQLFILTQTDNPLEIFKDQHPLGIHINPNHEQLCISNDQLTKIFNNERKEESDDF